jgi:hypothetical protein
MIHHDIGCNVIITNISLLLLLRRRRQQQRL